MKNVDRETCKDCDNFVEWKDGTVDCSYPMSIMYACLFSNERTYYKKKNVTESVLPPAE